MTSLFSKHFLQQLIISMIDIEKTQRKGRFTSIERKNSHNSWLWLVWEKTLTAFFGKEWYEQCLTHMRAEQALIITLVYKSIYCFNFFFNSLIEVFIILGKTLLTIQSYLIYVTCFNKVLLGLLKCQYGWSNILWLTLQTPSAQAVIKLVPSNEKLMSFNHVLWPVKVCTNVSLEISSSYGK